MINNEHSRLRHKDVFSSLSCISLIRGHNDLISLIAIRGSDSDHIFFVIIKNVKVLIDLHRGRCCPYISLDYKLAELAHRLLYIVSMSSSKPLLAYTIRYGSYWPPAKYFRLEELSLWMKDKQQRCLVNAVATE